LTIDDIDAFLRRAPRWRYEDGCLVLSATAPDFLSGIGWVQTIAQAAEQADHHPDIDIRWRTVTFRLTTHDVGAVTSLDTDLARAIDAVIDGSG
jgi:4a-hydroxytetrahydrobiopterin dehydratase